MSPQFITTTPIVQENAPDSTSEPSDWKKAHLGDDEAREKRIGFVEKVMEAGKQKLKESKQDKLKKSIRVLGPTNPRVVECYGGEERRPGYLGVPSGPP
jgi:hypothetical protein